ncbi:PQQ-dependent sugar dehydrogenase [Spirosoma sp. 209]|uniref:PQQ-dependent sugar dehydrogenase n=1 Tax=Spirosoma sp. 209 TaxID=1955701 RepID=UPI00098D4B6B|nr:PQQ-dependent sugar dehydrogenase [Spirosoma sp. 209]
MLLRLLVLILACVAFTPASAQLPTGFVQRQIGRNLNPTTLTFSPDGRLFVVEKDGRIREVIADALAPDPYITIPNVDITNERGLSGLCFHPDFPRTPFIYVYYTVKDQDRNRLSRFRANGAGADPKSETILLEFDKLAGTIHNAGVLRFGPDRKLYVATGEGSNAPMAQSMSSLLGKVIRLNDDGSIPADNPFVGQTTGSYRAIYALGLRNPFSMDIDPVSGRIIVGDVGGDAFEEINDIRAGRNYGWPLVEGRRTNQEAPANYSDPLYAYGHDPACAVTGVTVYNPPTIRFPAEYRSRIFFADYCAGSIQTLDPETGRLIGTFTTGIDRPIALATSPDGYLYYLARAGIGGGTQQDNTATGNGTLHKISFFDSGLPYITRQSANAFVAVGEAVTFEVGAVGQKPLAYQWYRNGKLLPGATQEKYTISSAMLADDGATFHCIVTNGLGTDTSEQMSLRVVQGQRPVAQIRTPTTNSTYKAGDVIAFAGSALTASQQPLGNAKLTWWINFHHEDHIHPALDPVTGPSNGIYRVPRVGETSTDVWYRIHLRVTDVSGLTSETSVDVKPELATVTIASSLSAVPFYLDGSPHESGYAFEAVVGTLRSLDTRPYRATPTGFFRFTGWSTGQSATAVSYEVPDGNSRITMNYQALAVPGGNGLRGEYFRNSTDVTGTPAFVRIDDKVDFDWGDNPVSPTLGNNNFTVRWMGKVLAPLTGTYTFHTETDDGVRLWVNNKLLIDKWDVQPNTEWTGQIELMAGQQYDIRMDYLENEGVANARLMWSSAQFDRAVIGKPFLFSAPIVTASQPETDGALTVFPSPAREQVTVRYVALKSGTAQIDVVDLLGRRTYTRPVRVVSGPNDYLIPVGDWPAGVYQIAVHPAGQPATYRRLLIR